MPVNRRCGDYAFNSCEDRMAILSSEVVPRRLAANTEIAEIEWSREIANNGYLYLDNGGRDCKVKLNDIMYADQVQADWKQEDEKEPDFIKNKPNLDNMVLPADFQTEVSYGSLAAGTIIQKGTSALDILMLMLTKSREVEVRWGVWASNLPNPVIYFGELGSGYQHKFIDRDTLFKEGFEATFNMGNTGDSHGGYFWVAIPKVSQLRCNKLFQGGHAITRSEGLVTCTPGNLPEEDSYWLMYRLNLPVFQKLGDDPIHCIFRFKEVNIDGTEQAI